MNGVWTVCRKDVRVALASPLLYVFWVVSALLVGGLFYVGLSVSPEPNLRILTTNLAVVNVVLLPLIAMGMFAEEEKQGTLEMLLTFPTPLWSYVGGKYLTGMVLSSGVFLCSMLCALVLGLLGNVDGGAVVSALIGQVLSVSFCLSVSLFASSLTKEPLAAGLLAVGLLLPFFVGEAFVHQVDASWWTSLIQDISLLEHLAPLSKGIVDLTDIGWFMMGTLFFLWMTTQMLEWKRCR